MQSQRSVLVLIAAGAMALTAASGAAQTASQPSAAQPAAVGKMEFEVASIRLSRPDEAIHSNIGLNIDNDALPPGGRLSAESNPVGVFIAFAYKVMPAPEQYDAMQAHLPKWAVNDRFDLEARFDPNATKDDLRLMMQALLAERFHLAAHFESREVPVLALVLVKAGRLGPRIRAHSEGAACDAKWTMPPERNSPSVPPGEFLPKCGSVEAIAGPRHTVLLGARNIPLDHIATYLPLLHDFGRPVVDRTGIAGTFDFSLNWLPEPGDPPILGPGASADADGPGLLEALKEQLGLKLEPAKSVIQVLVVDHIEQPTPN
jgi:bla regulator protein blaR1